MAAPVITVSPGLIRSISLLSSVLQLNVDVIVMRTKTNKYNRFMISGLEFLLKQRNTLLFSIYIALMRYGKRAQL